MIGGHCLTVYITDNFLVLTREALIKKDESFLSNVNVDSSVAASISQTTPLSQSFPKYIDQ